MFDSLFCFCFPLLFILIFLSHFSLGNFYWPILKFTFSFLICIESAEESVRGIIHLYYSVCVWMCFTFSIYIWLIVSISQLKFPVCSFMFISSMGIFNILVIIICNSLSENLAHIWSYLNLIPLISLCLSKVCFFSFSCFIVFGTVRSEVHSICVWK